MQASVLLRSLEDAGVHGAQVGSGRGQKAKLELEHSLLRRMSLVSCQVANGRST